MPIAVAQCFLTTHPMVKCVFSPSQHWRIQAHTIIAAFNSIGNALVARTSGAMALTWVLENGINLARVVWV